MRDIRQIRRRPGFVLVTVTLVGALLFISALMFVNQLTTESHVTKTDAYFKSALNIAETGLSNTLMDISQSVGTASWAQVFQSGGDTLDAVPSSAVHGTYQVDVDVVGTPESLGSDQYRGEVQVMSTGAVYTPAVTDMVASSEYAARRGVRMSTVATWTYVPPYTETTDDTIIPAKYEPTTFDIDYGVFTGGNLVIKGSSQEIHGDVFANGNVYIQKSSGLVGGDAYAAGTVTGGIPAGDKFPGQTPIPFPEIDIVIMHHLFDAYLRGTYPYNGTVAGMTNTSFTPLGLIQRAIWNVDRLVAAARVDGATGWYELPSMTPITADVCSALIDPSAVYYFDGDVKLASNSALSGTIVVDGQFFISGNVEVGTAGTLVNIIATGDVTKDTGCSEINGLVYTGGSFTGRGTADINGALIARNSVDMSGSFNLTYNDSLSPITIGGTLVTEEQFIPGETVYHPPFYNLDDFEQPVSGERMWQEVTNLD
ncbi:MAG: hypothetical protein WC625_07410 [Caldisericia bacterium]